MNKEFPTERDLRKKHGCRLQIGPLTFIEQDCEADRGKAYLTLKARVGLFKTREIRIPADAYEAAGDDMIRLRHLRPEDAEAVAAQLAKS